MYALYICFYFSRKKTDKCTELTTTRPRIVMYILIALGKNRNISTEHPSIFIFTVYVNILSVFLFVFKYGGLYVIILVFIFLAIYLFINLSRQCKYNCTSNRNVLTYAQSINHDILLWGRIILMLPNLVVLF